MMQHGDADLGVGNQLRGARYREYGGFGKIWQRGSEAEVAGSALEWRDSIGLLDDRTGCGFVRCHEYSTYDAEGG